jgi:mannosyltransferase OCH1-like enzyme
MFPKIIHQIWLQGADVIPNKYKKDIEKIKNAHGIYDDRKTNTEWKYMIWDEKRIIELLKVNSKALEKYYKYEYLHQKVDFAKLFITWYYGGIFLDIDVQLQKPFDSIFEKYKNYDFIVSEINNNFIINLFTCKKLSNCLNNGIFISKAKSDIAKYLYENLTLSTIMPSKMLKINFTTGPHRFNILIQKYKKDNSRFNKSKIIELPYDYFEPCSTFSNCQITANTYTKHYHSQTWIPEYINNFTKAIQKNNYGEAFAIFISSPVFTVLLGLILLIIIIIYIKKTNNISKNENIGFSSGIRIVY